jgi:hypothetical protein
MNLGSQDNEFHEIQQNAIVVLNKVGFSSELMKDKIASVTPDFSRRFHQELMNSRIFSSWDESAEWFTTGVPSQILKPGEQWQEGHFRLRITAEFVPDEPETIQTDRPIEPSLDTFRESP